VRHLGLDVGDVRVGVAISDETATVATGLPTIERVGPRKDVKAIAALVRERSVARLVVGLPKRLDGSVGPQGEKVLAFAEDLKRSVGVPVAMWDERFTTALAEKAFLEGGVKRRDRKANIDRAAATLILQSYLDAQKANAPVGSEPA
jgi:putative Holliday junction resolvase